MAYKIPKLKLKRKLWFIQPTNEGQELNYSEDFKGTLTEAKARGYIMKVKLQKALPKGEIGFEVLNKEAKTIYSE
jgi:hypothetical protein